MNIIKQFSKTILILGLMLSGCSPNRTNQHVYIGIATNHPHLIYSRQIITNSLLPIGFDRQLPDYVHIDDLSSEIDYYEIYRGQPKPKKLLEYQKIANGLEPLQVTPHNRLLVGLKRFLYLIKQRNNPTIKMRGVIILSEFSPSQLDRQEEEQLRYLVKELIVHKENLEILCLVGTKKGSKITNYFSDEAIRAKVVVTNPRSDEDFEDRCLR